MNIRYILALIARDTRRESYLVMALEEAMRTGSACEVKAKRQVLNQELEVKQIRCIVRAIFPAVRCKGIKAAGWGRVVETQRENVTIRSLVNQQSELTNELEICTNFQEHFTQLFGRSDEPENCLSAMSFGLGCGVL